MNKNKEEAIFKQIASGVKATILARRFPDDSHCLMLDGELEDLIWLKTILDSKLQHHMEKNLEKMEQNEH